MAPTTLVPLHAAHKLVNATTADATVRGGRGPAPVEHDEGLHVVVPSFDGHVYVVDGPSGCVDKVDVGEHRCARARVCPSAAGGVRTATAGPRSRTPACGAQLRAGAGL